MNSDSLTGTHSSYPQQIVLASTYKPVVVSPIFVVFYLLTGRCNPLFAVISTQFAVLIVLSPLDTCLDQAVLSPVGLPLPFGYLLRVSNFILFWLVIFAYLFLVPRCLSFRSFIHLTTCNPVMDNLPCECVIYVLTAIDNMSHALSGQSFDCFLQQSKIRIPRGIEYPSFNKFAFALFRMMSVVYPSNNLQPGYG
jgi:hypothetical protein